MNNESVYTLSGFSPLFHSTLFACGQRVGYSTIIYFKELL